MVFLDVEGLIVMDVTADVIFVSQLLHYSINLLYYGQLVMNPSLLEIYVLCIID